MLPSILNISDIYLKKKAFVSVAENESIIYKGGKLKDIIVDEVLLACQSVIA